MKKYHTLQRKRVTLSQAEAKALAIKYKWFCDNFEAEQNKFQISNDIQYYAVSKLYIEQWKQYACATNQMRQQPQPMNLNIKDGNNPKPGLKQHQDYVFVNPKTYNTIRMYNGSEIRRKAYRLKGKKIIEIYANILRYLTICFKDLKDISIRKKNKLELYQLQISYKQPVSQLIEDVKIESFLSNSHVRAWKVQEKDYPIEKLWSQIYHRSQSCGDKMIIDHFGQLLENQQKTLEEYGYNFNYFLIFQVYEDLTGIILRNQDERRCQFCNQYKKLCYPCQCKDTIYCCEECRTKDKRFHTRRCPNSDIINKNENLQMTITKNSRKGKVGLINLGNTCYMNSTLQCLSNTIQLTNYFLMKFYQKQINEQNPIGSKGRLALSYAKFIKNMWCSSSQIYKPSGVKAAISKISTNFIGYNQHDTQQFFTFLIDGLHEDLNRVKKKEYIEDGSFQDNKSDPNQSLKQWNAHLQRNQSIFVDLMTGLFKSVIQCDACHHKSIKFDPYLSISLPIPEKKKILEYFILSEQALKKKLLYKAYLLYDQINAELMLRQATKKLGRTSDQFGFYILTSHQNIYNFQSTSSAKLQEEIAKKRIVFLVQIKDKVKKAVGAKELPVRICLQDTINIKEVYYKLPFIFLQDDTLEDAFDKIYKFLYKIYKNGKKYQEFCQEMKSKNLIRFVCKSNKKLSNFFFNTTVDFSQQVEITQYQAQMSYILESIQFDDCQLDFRIQPEAHTFFNFDALKTYKQIEVNPEKNKTMPTVSLKDCIHLFQEKQKLHEGNEWYCNKCKKHTLATKQISIYKTPDILVLQLKRFKIIVRDGISRKTKVSAFVDFPFELNMKQLSSTSEPMSILQTKFKKQAFFIQPPYKISYKQSQPVYQLYAINNHFGNLNEGHYVAYCKNEGKWYEFNDKKVKQLSESELKTKDAYILYYRRKQTLKIE